MLLKIIPPEPNFRSHNIPVPAISTMSLVIVIRDFKCHFLVVEMKTLDLLIWSWGILILRPETGERTETKFMQIRQVLVFLLSMNKRHNFHQIFNIKV